MKQNIFTRSLVLLLGIIAIAVLTGFSLTACKTDAGDGGGDASIYSAWYFDANDNGTFDANLEDIVPTYEFKSDGTLVVGGAAAGFTFTVSGDQITLVTAGQAATTSITFSVSGKTLTLSGSTASGFRPGTYFTK
jgi:hypothetical protein